MKVQGFAKFDPGQYPVFASEDGQRFLEALNRVLTEHADALQGKLGTVNMNAETKTLELLHETPQEIAISRVRGRVQEIRVLSADLFDFVQIAWEHVSDRQVRVSASFASEPSTPVEVTLLFVGA